MSIVKFEREAKERELKKTYLEKAFENIDKSGAQKITSWVADMYDTLQREGATSRYNLQIIHKLGNGQALRVFPALRQAHKDIILKNGVYDINKQTTLPIIPPKIKDWEKEL